MQRSRRLRDALTDRRRHAEVFRYCDAELLADDCFHAWSTGREQVDESP